jgi:diguanylate cyclase (GGDEF)-like protein
VSRDAEPDDQHHHILVQFRYDVDHTNSVRPTHCLSRVMPPEQDHTDEPIAPASQAQQARESLHRLNRLAVGVTAAIEKCTENLNRLSAKTSPLSPADGPPAAGPPVDDPPVDSASAETLTDALTQVIQSNQRLKAELVAAQARFDEIARQLEVDMAEASRDALTGLANRKVFEEALQQRIGECRRRQSRLSLILVDVDHFKQINDRHGHLTGDDVLRGLARVLSGAVRQTDLVARFGGDEFACILPFTTLQNATRVAERIRTSVAAGTLLSDGSQLQITLSTGVAEFSRDDDAQTVLKRADTALYASKHAGRNCTHFHDGSVSQPVSNSSH